jgi:3',5'-cyclic AMP phosphodiesterase CpdA
MRIIQISDTHLSRQKAHFSDNWPPLAAFIAERRPEFVVHTGDVTVDGAEVEDDLRYAADLMHRLGVRFRAVPGNHDVGDAGQAVPKLGGPARRGPPLRRSPHPAGVSRSAPKAFTA